jgi:type III secretion protein J
MLDIRRLVVLVLAVALAACAVPVASSLDDSEASRVVVALDKTGIDGVKEPDPASEGRWRVTVSRDDVAQALGVLREQELPRAAPQGVLDAVGKGSLVPSEGAEHAQLVTGMAGDLERTLQSIDGVLSARVHLSIPTPGPLRDAPTTRATASVLLEHVGSTPPITADSVQRLVAGGCSGMLPADVAVVMVSRPAPPRPPGSELTHVGPVAVAHASARLLKALLAGAVAAIAALSLSLVLLLRKHVQVRDELAQAQAAAGPARRSA